MKNHNKLTAVILTGIFLSSCSSSSSSNNNQGGNNGNNGDASTLQVITPKIIYSKTTTNHGYIVVNNPGDQTISNLHYTLSNQYGSGSTAIINEASANSCAIIPAHSQCNVEISVPAGAIAGSLGFSAENTSSSSSSTNKASQASNRTPIMQVGIEQAYYNNSITGADGITLSYYHTVIAGVPYILVTGIVASNKAGSFNNIVLVDSHDNAIPNQQLISGSINSAQGSTFSILLPVSASSSISQTIKVQTQQITDGKVTAHATATAGSTLVTTSGVGIADLLPGAVYLTSNHPEQVITFANTGDAVAQLQKLAASNSNIEVIFTPSNLNSGAITTATLKLKNPAVPATSGSVTLNYNNSKEDTKSSAVTEQNITPQPTPTPTPSPTPTPAPPPGPTAGLTLIFNPDNNFFTTTAIHTVSRQLTIRNSGNTAENNFQITLPPANFSISNGISDTCTISGSTLTNSLTPNQACTVTVTYNNSTATVGEDSDEISVAYDYNGTTPATPAKAEVNYQVTQSTAVLSLVPSTAQIYSAITSNNSSVSTPITFLLVNTGDESATNLNFIFDAPNPEVFHVVSGGTGSCSSGGSLSSQSGINACTIATQFGPAGSAGNKSSMFDVGYTPFSGATTTSYTSLVALYGTVNPALSATFTSSITANTFTSGSGTLVSPYGGDTGSNYTLSVTYTNTSPTIAATGFGTTYASLPSGWTLNPHGCNNAPMAANGGTCTDVYTLNSATAGSHDLNLANATAGWSDSSGAYPSQTVSGVGTVYTTLQLVIPPASLSGTMSSYTFTTGNGTQANKFSVVEAFSPAPTVTYTISNSSTGPANNFYVDWPVPDNGWSQTASSCGTSASPITISGNGNCSITFELDTTGAGEYDLNLPSLTMYWTNFGSATQQSQQLSGIIYAKVTAPPKMIFVSTTGTTGAFGSFTNANIICQNDAAAGSKTAPLSATWFALLRGNNATTSGTTYVTTMNETIAIATGTDLIATGATNNTLTHAIDKDRDGSPVSQLIWTGGAVAGGSSSTTKNCSNWSSDLSTRTGSYGGTDTTTWWNYIYSATTYYQLCDQVMSLYCVQQ